jgi:hypothetical protein
MRSSSIWDAPLTSAASLHWQGVDAMKLGNSDGHNFYNDLADLPYQTCADVDVLFRRRKTGKHLERRSNGKWHVLVIVVVVLSSACVLLIQLARGRELESSRDAANVADELRARPRSSPARDP